MTTSPVETSTTEAKLKEVVSKLGTSYRGWKDNEKVKDEARKEFFGLATEALRETTLAEEVVELPAKSLESATDLFEKKYPGWIVEEVRVHPDKDGHFEAIISENPELMAYIFEHDGWRYKRQVTKGSVYVDDERLREEDPDLWEEVTEIPYKGLFEELLYNSGVDSHAFDEEFEGAPPLWKQSWVIEALEKHGLGRRLKDLDSLDPVALAKLQNYMYESAPSIKLAAPTKVKGE